MFISRLIAGFAALISIASVEASYDPSNLGTPGYGILPPYLRNNPLPHGYPWGTLTTKNDPKNAPNTGITRNYDFTIARGHAAPDGYLKPVILINGQFPGPLIQANWGDWIQVNVVNNITGPEEGTSVHWHGMFQKDTQWMDGVPSITQCPIAPGASFTYQFRANVYGTSWYHSHYSAQYSAGVAGPMVIYGPAHEKYDVDLGVVMVSDYYHTEYGTLVANEMSSNSTLQVQWTDNTLINGRMPYNCSSATSAPKSVCTNDTSYSKFRVQTGKTYKIRLINPGTGSVMYTSIDGHELTVISNDFVNLVPYKTKIVTLGVGQRSDVLFTPKGNGSIWLRTIASGAFCGAARSHNPEARAVLLLNDAPDDTFPTTSAWPPPVDNGLCANDPLSSTVPYVPIAPPPPSITYNIVIDQIINATGQKLFLMNKVPFQGDYNDPILLLTQQKNYSYPYDPKWNVVNFGTNSSIRVNVYNNNSSPHPMHLHGHDMYILHDGPGPWDGTSITNPTNPQRRDTHNLAPYGHMVMQFDADNPGAWPFHCHIAWHLSQGLLMTFLERPQELTSLKIPMTMAQTCGAWEAWTAAHAVAQIDSGLKRRGREGERYGRDVGMGGVEARGMRERKLRPKV